jgi:hypothetical protein
LFLACCPCASVSPLASSGFGFQSTSLHVGTKCEHINGANSAIAIPGTEEIAGMRHFANVAAPDASNRIMLG